MEIRYKKDGVDDVLLRKMHRYYVEALSLCKNMSKGIVSMTKLEAQIQVMSTQAT